jgi:putative Mg2+ transporter-C (MgtC) family protein
MLELSEVALRLGAAAAIGVVIGMNRDLADKPIGMRTLALVTLGAASVAVAGMQVPGMAGNADALSRVIQGIIQGVMAGISFIGAGVILRNAEARTVEGLTTAATVWVAAALGIACGLGMWNVAVIGTVIAVVLLVAARLAELIGLKKPNQTKPDRNLNS